MHCTMLKYNEIKAYYLSRLLFHCNSESARTLISWSWSGLPCSMGSRPIKGIQQVCYSIELGSEAKLLFSPIVVRCCSVSEVEKRVCTSNNSYFCGSLVSMVKLPVGRPRDQCSSPPSTRLRWPLWHHSAHTGQCPNYISPTIVTSRTRHSGSTPSPENLGGWGPFKVGVGGSPSRYSGHLSFPLISEWLA